jgi:hypothetical protein
MRTLNARKALPIILVASLVTAITAPAFAATKASPTPTPAKAATAPTPTKATGPTSAPKNAPVLTRTADGISLSYKASNVNEGITEFHWFNIQRGNSNSQSVSATTLINECSFSTSNLTYTCSFKKDSYVTSPIPKTEWLFTKLAATAKNTFGDGPRSNEEYFNPPVQCDQYAGKNRLPTNNPLVDISWKGTNPVTLSWGGRDGATQYQVFAGTIAYKFPFPSVKTGEKIICFSEKGDNRPAVIMNSNFNKSIQDPNVYNGYRVPMTISGKTDQGATLIAYDNVGNLVSYQWVFIPDATNSASFKNSCYNAALYEPLLKNYLNLTHLSLSVIGNVPGVGKLANAGDLLITAISDLRSNSDKLKTSNDPFQDSAVMDFVNDASAVNDLRGEAVAVLGVATDPTTITNSWQNAKTYGSEGFKRLAIDVSKLTPEKLQEIYGGKLASTDNKLATKAYQYFKVENVAGKLKVTKAFTLFAKVTTAKVAFDTGYQIGKTSGQIKEGNAICDQLR